MRLFLFQCSNARQWPSGRLLSNECMHLCTVMRSKYQFQQLVAVDLQHDFADNGEDLYTERQ